MNFMHDDGFDRSAAISYYALFSLVPFLVVIGLVGSWFFGSSAELLDRILEALRLVLPTVSDPALAQAQGAAGRRGWILFLLLPFLLWTASYAAASLEASINHILRMREHRRFLSARLKSIALLGVVSTVLLLVPALLQVIAVLRRISTAQSMAPAGFLQIVVTEAAILLAGFLAYTFILGYLPARTVPLRTAAAIAAPAALAWEVARMILARALAFTSGGGLVSGSFSVVLGLLLWVYVSSVILLLAAELLALVTGRREKPVP